MPFKAFHAMLTLIVGFAGGIAWLRAFWTTPRRAPACVLAAPVAAGCLLARRASMREAVA